MNREIEVIAPSSASAIDVKVLEEMTKLYSTHGFKVNIPNNLIDPLFIYHSNSDGYRTEHFRNSVFQSKADIIWCLRGGYGAAKVCDRAQHMPIPNTKKVLIGCSDTTALHLFVNKNWGWKSIHGAVFYKRPTEEPDFSNMEIILRMLKGEIKEIEIPKLELIANQTPLETITGVAIGGNLTLIESGISTCWELAAANKILFLEDIDERGYRVDRSLFHLLQSGLLKNVKAIVYGDIVGGDEKDGSNLVRYALENLGKELKISIFHTPYFGHGKLNYPFIIGGEGRIEKNINNLYTFKQKVDLS